VEFNSFGPAVGRLGSDSSRGGANSAKVEAEGAEPPPHLNHCFRLWMAGRIDFILGMAGQYAISAAIKAIFEYE